MTSLVPRLVHGSGTRRPLRCWLLALLVLASASLPARQASACSADVPVRHRAMVATDGAVLAHAGPTQETIRIDATGARVVPPTIEPHARMQVRAFSPDSRTMLVAIDDYADADRGAGCMATYVHLIRVDLATGTQTELQRLRSAGADSLEISPDGQLALVMALDFGGEPVVHLFDLVGGQRSRVTRDVRAWFLDASTLLVLGEDDRMRVVSAADARVIATLPAPARGETMTYLPGATRTDVFSLVVRREGGRSRLVEVTLRGSRATIRAVRLRVRGLPLAITADRSLALLRDGPAMRVVALATGTEVIRFTTGYRYTTGALSADGATVALVSVPRPPRDPDEMFDQHAFMPATVERFELPSGTRVSWGPGAASGIVRPPS